MYLGQQGAKFSPDGEAVGGATPNVKRLPRERVGLLNGHLIQAHQIMHMEQVAHLFAIAINSDGTAEHGGDDEMRHPALVFHPKLARAIDARLAQNDGFEAVNTAVIEHILVARPFGTAVGRVKIERVSFGDARWVFGVFVAGGGFADV